jgi:ABC-type glycerol-3-phosphate transport system substrate-binding protein
MPDHCAATPLTRRNFLKIVGIGGTLASATGIRRTSAQSATPNPSAKASLTIFDFGDANIEGVRATITQNLILPLDDFIAHDPTSKEYLKDVAPALSDALKFEGKTYYLTREWNNMCIHYNTKAFEEAGIERPRDDWTWDDFITIAEKLTKGEAGNRSFGFGLPFFNFGLQP